MPSSTDRERLAERLHDGPQQEVTAIRLLTDAARTALDAGETDTARRALDRIAATADEAANSLRDEVSRLRHAQPGNGGG
jgi:signal transduction histidine kinase